MTTSAVRNSSHKAILAIWIGLNVLVAAVTVFTGYAGCIDPEKMPFAGLAGMTFAGWWLLNLIILVVDLFVVRLLAILPTAALLICLKPFWAFCPLNFSTPEVSEADSARTFRILSYNCLNLTENEPENAGNGYNRTLNTILNSGADVLVLAEFPDYALEMRAPKIQADSMYALYPYHIYGKNNNALFSKTPIMYAVLPSQQYGSGSHEIYRTVIDGHGLMIFGVHMVSFGLNDEDKELYRDLTEMERDKISLSGLRTHLLDKLYDAYKLRSVQAMYIREYVDQLTGEDIIVAGDFNDVPDCRPIRILEEAGLKSVYSEVGFGPMITFNNPTMPFRIDHVMYKGNIRPVKMERGDLKSSDHYPLLTTFVWNE